MGVACESGCCGFWVALLVTKINCIRVLCTAFDPNILGIQLPLLDDVAWCTISQTDHSVEPHEYDY